ncbi:GntR family transcriptional regulator [Streptomyces rugosispiralis]|uniref:GntR family transcriptional regulator n=1 Tax=Streptomyces rugosispiralis TaxID=2967341 RepID=A0ABT1UPC7_9ACTN|nr:GntR family transcriptional regulator [Streptomyces rugosispiralis]MCQ8186999.1 GntR family transcriptional regulator [Streptomyces rugosispiralis]
MATSQDDGHPGSHYNRIRQSIVSGQAGPGTVLIPTVLSTQYNVSRTPVREALIRLEQDGLVERATRGYVVRTRTPEEILEICEARIALESSAAQAAAIRRTELDLARLVHVHESTAATKDPAELRELNHLWHVALREAGHNTTIAELMDRLDAQLKVYDSHTAPATDLPDNLSLILEEHAGILDAVRRRDAGAARDRMIAHQSRTRDLRIGALARSGRAAH